jgi:16S rRNA (guanine527-N7)-methyltransferase
MMTQGMESKKIRFVVEAPQFKRQEKDLTQLLSEGLEHFNLKLTPANHQKLLDYIDLMIKWNRAYNLTSVREPSEIMVRHIFDSWAAGPHLHGDEIIDVGSGAGLPGIPLALAYPEKRFTLIDSNGKKARFLFHVQQILRIPNLNVVNERVEGYQKSNQLNEVSRYSKYTTIISRAFSSLREMLYNTEHLCHYDGQFLAMKGVYPLTELHEIPQEFKLLDVVKLQVPFLDGERHLVKISFE